MFEDVVKNQFGYIPSDQLNYNNDFILDAKKKFELSKDVIDIFAKKIFIIFKIVYKSILIFC